MVSRLRIVFLVIFWSISTEASSYDRWHTSAINTDPWGLIDSGRYGLTAIQATSVKVGHDALEVVTISIDCLNGEMVPNIRYSFISSDGLQKLNWWQVVSGSIVVEVGPSSFDFGRVTYNLGHHPYMMMHSDDKKEFMNALSEVGAEIIINAQVPADGEVRKLAVSSKNYKPLYGILANSCTK